MTYSKLIGAVVSASCLAACASGPFDTSWRSPEATPLRVEGAKVAAIAMMVAKELQRQGLLPIS